MFEDCSVSTSNKGECDPIFEDCEEKNDYEYPCDPIFEDCSENTSNKEECDPIFEDCEEKNENDDVDDDPCSDCIEREGGYICSGNDAAPSTLTESKEDCSQSCFNELECAIWTFNSNNSTCWLKNIARSKLNESCINTQPDWTWGSKQCGKK